MATQYHQLDPVGPTQHQQQAHQHAQQVAQQVAQQQHAQQQHAQQQAHQQAHQQALQAMTSHGPEIPRRNKRKALSEKTIHLCLPQEGIPSTAGGNFNFTSIQQMEDAGYGTKTNPGQATVQEMAKLSQIFHVEGQKCPGVMFMKKVGDAFQVVTSQNLDVPFRCLKQGFAPDGTMETPFKTKLCYPCMFNQRLKICASCHHYVGYTTKSCPHCKQACGVKRKKIKSLKKFLDDVNQRLTDHFADKDPSKNSFCFSAKYEGQGKNESSLYYVGGGAKYDDLFQFENHGLSRLPVLQHRIAEQVDPETRHRICQFRSMLLGNFHFEGPTFVIQEDNMDSIAKRKRVNSKRKDGKRKEGPME